MTSDIRAVQRVGMIDVNQLVTAADLARLLRVSPRKLRAMVATGQAPPSLRIGRLRRWRARDVESWLDRQTAADLRKAG
jgi:excisionase family DNA binding protein